MLRLAYIFIAHDLSVVRHFTDRVMVMFQGNTRRLPAASPIPEPAHPAPPPRRPRRRKRLP